MTTPISVSAFLGDIKQYVFNPAAMQRAIMEMYDAMNNGQIQIVDATNPFVFALETSTVNTSLLMQQNAALHRRQNPAAATTFEDLYLHMSDLDYAGIFALPSEAVFTLGINLNDLNNALVADGASGISKVTIPRNTRFTVQGVSFSLQYPIDIRKLEHGALQIVYDASKPSPLQNLPTNVISYQTLNNPDGTSFIVFEVAVQQFDITTAKQAFSTVTGQQLTVPFDDQFYAARVYVSNSDLTWREIAVTYTDQVYNPTVPTAALRVVDNTLQVRLPLLYISSNQIAGQMRVDVYHTRGPLDLPLDKNRSAGFTAEFLAYDQNDKDEYVAAMVSIPNVYTFADGSPVGGRNALTFAELQARVIKNSVGPRQLPITPSQIQAMLLDRGYSLVKNIDVLTDRYYWATKALPAPRSSSLVSSANANVANVVLQVGQADTLHGCYSHPTGMTIGSQALVLTENGIAKLVTKAGHTSLTAQQLADQCSILNAGKYSYTPFYYVLDTTQDSFVVRPYYLDDPKVPRRTFVQENPDTSLQTSIAANYSLSKTATGYRLVLTTLSSEAYRALPDAEVFCQLHFQSASQAEPAFMLGEQQERAEESEERVFVFDITTNYDLSADNALALTSFDTPSGGVVPRSALEQPFNVLFITSNADAMESPTTAIDTYVGTHQVPAGAIGLTHEVLTLRFGYALETLWNSFRSFTSSIPYQTYLEDVPKTYDQDVYDRDPITGAMFKIVDGQPVWDILHAQGDPVEDEDGDPIMLHLAGELILDNADRPIPVAGYETSVLRALDLVTLDAVYQFANDPVTTEYVTQIRADLLNSLTVDLVGLNQFALEKTEIYYYPAITQGTVNAIADNNQVVNLEAAQSLNVQLHVPLEVFNNKNLTASLQSATIRTVGDFLSKNPTVAVSHLEDALMAVYGSDVLGVTVTGLGGANNYRVVSVTNDSTRMSIRKELKLLPTGQLAVLEAISVSFNAHGFTSL